MRLSREKIDLQRAERCMTVEDLAKQYGVSRTRMNVILNQRELSPVSAGRLAKALNCNVTDILE